MNVVEDFHLHLEVDGGNEWFLLFLFTGVEVVVSGSWFGEWTVGEGSIFMGSLYVFEFTKVKLFVSSLGFIHGVLYGLLVLDESEGLELLLGM